MNYHFLGDDRNISEMVNKRTSVSYITRQNHVVLILSGKSKVTDHVSLNPTQDQTQWCLRFQKL